MSQEWRLLAACRGTDPEAPFADPGSLAQQAFVRAYCRGCPVRRECLAFGARSGYGVFGGLNAIQRGRMTGPRPRPPVVAGPLPTCGTVQGYRHHREKLFEDACAACKAAWTEYCRERKLLRLGRTA